MTLVVIEGTDRAGKTTLANELAAIQPSTGIIHAAKPTHHPLIEYETSLRTYDPRGDVNLVLDRWHLGEAVWPAIFGRETDFDLAMLAHVELFLASRGAYGVYAYRFDTSAQDAELVEHGEPIYGETLYRALDEYVELLNNCVAMPWKFYGFDNPDFVPRTRTLVNTAKFRAWDVSQVWDVTSEWVGVPRPRVLLVGERFGNGGSTLAARVPFVPFRGTSGHYLFSQLRAGGEEWQNMALLNAFKDGSLLQPERLNDAWHAMEEPLVIGLGRVACQELTHQGVPHEVADHPQYWRRFKRATGPLGYHAHLQERGL